ncbi:capsid protein [Staphylococcus epidermidis]|uniref:capsid protein n=2 Tax=Staphylococcus epidermidis TaxID=1282 RepID=UPI001E45E69F|nr:capsid protein [Staphylococcus epidermidis]MCD9074098.1 capsid protein [Staphylococcus epidermidis]MCG2381071.1 capsid protein [Staphylococcus epidermidis]
MAVENNLIKTEYLGTVKSIDLANKNEIGLTKLFEALSITNKIPMSVGQQIKQYSFVVSDRRPSPGEKGIGGIAEGEEIPLTEIRRLPQENLVLEFKKFRKSTSAETIQAHGFDLAINKTDNELLKYVQRTLREDFFASLRDALEKNLPNTKNRKTPYSGKTLQGALAKGRAVLSTVMDTDITPIAFVNPNDTAEHIANGLITSNGAQFGMGLLTNFVGIRVVEFSDVPEGEVWMTVAENLNVASANPNGELSKAFNLVTDQTGLVGVMHNVQPTRLTSDTIIMSATKMFPENVDAVIKVLIRPSSNTESSHL